MSWNDIKYKILHKWTKLRLAPIRVFCFHQTSAVFNPDTMIEGDWTEIEQFKRNILFLQKEWTFISLPEAHSHLQQDTFRRKKYAVLTSDDGWASLKEILPWLIEQQIPVTLFLNPAYMDGQHYREKDTEKYLSLADVKQAVMASDGLITIGLHGWEHKTPYKLSEEEFVQSIAKSLEVLQNEPGYVPYFAFPWGYGNRMNLTILTSKQLIPVFCDGQANYVYQIGISRELLDNGYCLKREYYHK